MPNMLDYIAWRGDLSLAQDALNENDELILSQLAYVAFGDYVPGKETPDKGVSLNDAVSWLLQYDEAAEKIHQTGFMWKNNVKLLKALRTSKRFGDIRLLCYVDSISPEDEKQFAAVTFDLGDGSHMVAFRGTDDTLIGWKEDLNMVFECPVPAQREAALYLDHIATHLAGDLRVTGHSKGGNLAIYAASCCAKETQGRIVSVVSHDGPGQSEQTLLSEGYAAIRDRLRVYIPHFSLVGMLLEHENNYTTVQSDAKSVLQHDAFSWQMQGRQMLYADAPSESSISTNRILRKWMETLDDTQRRLFVDAIYEVASATYGDTIPEDVETNWPLSAQGVFSAVLKLDAPTRSLFTKGLGDLFSTAIKSIRFPWQKEDEREKKAAMEDVLDTVKLEEKASL